MLFADVVSASAAVRDTRSRTKKRAALAKLLRTASSDEAEIVIGFLTGEPRQGRIGIGWRTVSGLERAPATTPSLDVGVVDGAIEELQRAAGPGSRQARIDLLDELWGRATAGEQRFLAELFVGELRQGALEGVMADAIAEATGLDAALVRRAAMLRGSLGPVGALAIAEGEAGLAAVGLQPGRAVQPMLASTADDVAAAVATLGDCSVEWKLDGARVQVHKVGDTVRVFTRNLNDVSDRSPETVAVVAALDTDAVVLDGEVLALDPRGRPHPFQDTMGRFGSDDGSDHGLALAPFFFDVLHADGEDLLDRPLGERLAVLDRLVPPEHRVPRARTADATDARTVLDEAVARGHEGVMVKAVDSEYQAGRRGKAWQKVKPVHTFDLVVLAAEWGHGRRQGWLSNLHLGARDGSAFVMVGKTFKGMTDELLGWQTERLQEIATGGSGITVTVRPELVVEIALDGVQRSSRYPGGIALRFARVKGYRPDKSAEEADELAALQALLR